MSSVALLRSLGRNCRYSNLLRSSCWRKAYILPLQSSINDENKLNLSSSLQFYKHFSASTIKRAAPEIEQSGHDHVLHWTAERILSVVLLTGIPAAVIFPIPATEYLLALSLTVHSHWGIEALVVDYIRPSVFGTVIPKVSVATVYLLSFLTLGGLGYFIYTDVGLVTAVKMLWKL